VHTHQPQGFIWANLPILKNVTGEIETMGTREVDGGTGHHPHTIGNEGVTTDLDPDHTPQGDIKARKITSPLPFIFVEVLFILPFEEEFRPYH